MIIYTRFLILLLVKGRKDKIWGNDAHRPIWWPCHIPFVSSNQREKDKCMLNMCILY